MFYFSGSILGSNLYATLISATSSQFSFSYTKAAYWQQHMVCHQREPFTSLCVDISLVCQSTLAKINKMAVDSITEESIIFFISHHFHHLLCVELQKSLKYLFNHFCSRCFLCCISCSYLKLLL